MKIKVYVATKKWWGEGSQVVGVFSNKDTLTTFMNSYIEEEDCRMEYQCVVLDEPV